MYRVYWDTEFLHDLSIPEEYGYYLKNPTLKEEVNKIAELNFDIYPTHPTFDNLEKLVPNIIVKKNNKIIFKGRIIKEKQNMDNSKQVTCESVLAFLFDSVQRPFQFQGSPEELFAQFINNHNSQVEEYKRFKIGKTTGANLDNNEYINRSSESYLDTWEAIETRLLNIGGYLLVRYEEDGNYIDWVDDFTDGDSKIASAQTIEFGENLIDITVENDGTEVYSVIIPLGVQIEHEDGTKTRLTIESVNDGLDYLVNEDALNKYGWIVAPIEQTTWDDVTVASNLKTKAEKLLNLEGVFFKSRLELKAVDLNVVDGSIDSFEMGEYIKCQSTPHNLSKLYLLTKKETPLCNPENMQITLGETRSSLTGMQLGDSQSMKEEIKNIKTDIKVNEAQTDQALNEIKQEVYSNSSLIEQTATELRTEVSENYYSKGETDTLITEQKTALEQTKDSFEMTFEGFNADLKNLTDDTNTKFEEYKKFIRFEDGKILLGEVGNQIELQISNDRISFLQSGYEVAYLSNGKLYITDGEFIHSLKIGKFSYIPRANGYLDFKRVT